MKQNSSTPLLTVLVPTRNRPELLAQCLARLIDQELPHAEIIVLQNSDDPSTKLAAHPNFPELRTIFADRPLDMPANWERGLWEARGRYLTIVSDKDMFLPGALKRLCAELETGRHEILCYRRAWYCDVRRLLFHYRCNGEIRSAPLKPLLRDFFSKITHRHNAPMLSNSAVSVELINTIGKKEGRFFFGNSPDVSSAVLFAAYRESYSQLDATLSVAHSGEWSAGDAGKRFGRNSTRTKEFASMFKSDPFMKLGLPYCIPSAVLEVLLAAKESHPQNLKGYNPDWYAFLAGVEKAINSMEIPAAQKHEDWAVLSSRKSIVPRTAYFSYMFDRYCRQHPRCNIFLAPLNLTIQRLRNIGGGCNSTISDRSDYHPWDDLDSIWRTTPANGIDEALEIASRDVNRND